MQTTAKRKLEQTKHADGFTTAPDGIKLYYQHWRPGGSVRATLAFVHGYLEHSGRYRYAVDFFTRHGYEIFAFDYRGHGQSGGRRAHVFRYDEYLTDVECFINLILTHRATDRKLFLVGHSNGGLVALRYVMKHPEGFDGLILSAPYIGNKVKIPVVKRWAGKALSGVWPTLALSTGLGGGDLTRDPEAIAAWEADPLVIKTATTRWFTECTAAQEDVVANPARLRTPVLFVQGTADRLADPDANRRFFESLSVRDKEFRSYDGGFHELFNDVERERVFADVDDWLNRRI